MSIILQLSLGIVLSIVSPIHNNHEPTSDEKIIFTDEFEQEAAIPDTTVWRLCQYGNNAWAQHFKHVDGYENVRVEDGVLKLKASKENGTYKNGGIRTRIGFPCDTRLEVKAKLAKRIRGGFPAIWQMPINAPQWPRGGEVDLMEWVQGTPMDIYQTVHTYFINGEQDSSGMTNPDRPTNFDVTDYHIYAAERTEDAVIFYIDGKETWRYANQYLPKEQMQYPFCDYMYDIILNFSLGGELNGNSTWPGKIYDEDLPGEMWIDWVRITLL